MAPSPRELITLDLCGLKGRLVERARADHVSTSAFVRKLIGDALGLLDTGSPAPMAQPPCTRVRVFLRLLRKDADALAASARARALPMGEFVAGLVAGIPAYSASSSPRSHVEALVASCAELSTLARDLRHLSELLSHGSVEAAMQYRARLDSVGDVVRDHISLASSVLADLRPRPAATQSAQPSRRHHA
jgi:hypothetical protein